MQAILSELSQIKEKLGAVEQSEQELKTNMRMIFADLTHFENLVLKILDHRTPSLETEKYQH
ncbi:MAG TPA: hypothetical protein VJC18_11125 [bacterium]|nr:hypothetical protein [bacterium]